MPAQLVNHERKPKRGMQSDKAECDWRIPDDLLCPSKRVSVIDPSGALFPEPTK